MRQIFTMFICLNLLFLISCTHQPSYVERISARPYPTDQQAINIECVWIRSEIAVMSSIRTRSLQATALSNIAALESRAANLRCGAAFSTIIEKQDHTSSISECIKACKESTNRTPEQCFDACNK